MDNLILQLSTSSDPNASKEGPISTSEGVHQMLPVAIVMTITYVAQIVLLIREFMPKEIKT